MSPSIEKIPNVLPLCVCVAGFTASYLSSLDHSCHMPCFQLVDFTVDPNDITLDDWNHLTYWVPSHLYWYDASLHYPERWWFYFCSGCFRDHILWAEREEIEDLIEVSPFWHIQYRYRYLRMS